MTALFIPLKTEYYEAFKRGEKSYEFRKYGKRWNEETCYAGREVVISKGYGKKDRMRGKIQFAIKTLASQLPGLVKCSVMACYGTTDIEILQIKIIDLVAEQSLSTTTRTEG